MKDNEKNISLARPKWDDYFMFMAMLASTRSTCLRRKVGAIAVMNKRVLATGYNGAPSEVEDCIERGYCERERLNVPSGQRHELCRAIHAEQNLIIQAAKSGISLENTSVYCTTYPCLICAKMLINLSIKELYFLSKYSDNETEKLFDESGIKTIRMSAPKINILGNFD